MESYLPNFNLEGKLSVITGATKGIGRAIAFAYAESGSDVILIARNEEDLIVTSQTIEENFGVKTYTIASSVMNLDYIINHLSEITEGQGIDILVNNAGMNIRSEALDVKEDEYQQIIDTNMKSALFLSKFAAQNMLDHKKKGKIINISSVAGQTALRTGVVYAMTKAGLIQMTKTLSMEWGKHGINVNAIGPWYFPTSLTEKLLQDKQYVQDIVARTPLKRIGKLEEIAGPAVFLASDASNYMTGQTLMVDGGMTIYGF
ncbi:SDR family NAD(P)-dependent oxidoreductase [Aquisalibacillus elongatus]|uniref:NAD(P)-dependent dehydrogenase (Short-subunit alcohol dehydrogenase family) n=1 Tax=Aquisalibacillus elongatus TaxID=485577 RepID=A0A3N5BG88_9BACI|nr:SDR family oxidoreductase [Aquisalibacillus elongatus]RPF55809.1 NAD(P)-dependent dehydrogenase (short-subunit alcohol dehydrogenase family) [Aquisalibacillus elongatus]